MFSAKKLPLKAAWYGLIFLASLLPALALSPWLSQQAHSLLLDRAMLEEELFHKEMEIHLRLETERLVSVLLNKSDPISYFMRDGDKLDLTRKLIQKIIRRESMINTTTLYDRHANIIISSHRGKHTPAHIDKDSPAFAIPMFNRTYIGSPGLLSDNHYEFMIAVPIVTGSDVSGVMISTININDFWHHIRSKVADHNSMVYLVDGRGSLLTHLSETRHQQGDLLSDKAIVRSLLAGKDWHKPEVYEGFEGNNVFGIATLVRGLHWGLISEIPSSTIISPIISSLTALTLIVVLLHVIFGLISLLFTKRLLSPISDLAQVVKRATQGDYRHEVHTSAYREIDDLSTSFNTMIHEIENRENSLRKLSQAIEQAGESIIITNRDGIIEYVNPAFSHMTGFSRDEIIGKSPGILSSGRQNKAFYTQMWESILSGESWEGMLTDRKKDGSLYPVMMNIAAIYAGDEITHFVAIQQDMSEQNQLEEQLRQSQKMESLGTLVGGIAHDFNNILGAMTGNMYLIKKRAADNEMITDKVEKLESLAFSAANMISQLLAFSRQASVQMDTISLTSFIRDSLSLSSSSISENISLTTRITEEPLAILGDATQLQQILMNLLNNARDAVENTENPAITVSVQPFHATQQFLQQHHELSAETYARISISDNGMGISEDNLNNIFEPFFTTKDIGKGSGLGLSMVFGAMHTHGGTIEVESTPGTGTTFHLYFPARDMTEITTEHEQAIETAGHGELLLLADDEAQVLETNKEVLETLGYKVLTASNGRDAIHLFKQHKHEIQLVLTDVVMPGMGGVAMAEEILQIKANTPIIYTTGYDKEQVLPDQVMENALILTKPLDVPELSQQVSRLLSQDD
ncbi:blue-light-activated protein [Mariprofundus micogutta]|uniref:histidine kinase n=1 Tax=Mariprofundus micogutta TaxID=1921010 RepID=A0A1L8CKN0_9PROT|nr:ATP-binding protein [Mariprofundus micogutta]GAV19463.1 blue-light-activated protein [Mariprofundus micogutta]